QQKLLGEVRKDANAVDPLIDHAVENAAHAVVMKLAVIVKRRRRDREYPCMRLRFGHDWRHPWSVVLCVFGTYFIVYSPPLDSKIVDPRPLGRTVLSDYRALRTSLAPTKRGRCVGRRICIV